MHVQVEYGLSRPRTHIQYGSVAVLDAARTCKVSGYQVTAADQLGVFRRSFLQTDDMLLGNHQQVRRGFAG